MIFYYFSNLLFPEIEYYQLPEIEYYQLIFYWHSKLATSAVETTQTSIEYSLSCECRRGMRSGSFRGLYSVGPVFFLPLLYIYPGFLYDCQGLLQGAGLFNHQKTLCFLCKICYYREYFQHNTLFENSALFFSHTAVCYHLPVLLIIIIIFIAIVINNK